MVELNPHALYTREDLIDLLSPLGVDADGFVARIKPVKRFRLAWYGEDLLAAIRKAPPLDGGQGQPAAIEAEGVGSARQRRGSERAMSEPLQRLIREHSR